MGITHANIEVENLFSKRRMSIQTLVDSGVVFMTIPEHIALQLGYDLEEVSQREVVLGDEPIFGAVPMEMMDLVLHPATQTLSVNQESPFVPSALVK